MSCRTWGHQLQRSSAKGTATAVLTILALIAFAGNSVFCRLALAGPIIDPASYTAIRLITGAVTLWIITAFRRKESLRKSGGSWISAAMLFLYAVTFSFAYISLSAGTGALILFAAVQITMIAVGLHRGERPETLEWLGLFIAIVGLIYLVSPGITAPSIVGSLLMATAGIAWGVYSLKGARRLRSRRHYDGQFFADGALGHRPRSVMAIDLDHNSNGFSLGSSIRIHHIGSRLRPVVRSAASPDSDAGGYGTARRAGIGSPRWGCCLVRSDWSASSDIVRRHFGWSGPGSFPPEGCSGAAGAFSRCRSDFH